MSAARTLPGILMLFLLGCDPIGDSAAREARKRQKTAIETFKASAAEALESAKSLRLYHVSCIPDGGSWVFSLVSDEGFDFNLQALHQLREKDEATGYQRFLIYQDRLEFEVIRGSPIEARLIRLLGPAEIFQSPKLDWKPTAETLEWLLARLQNRDLPFTSVPVLK